MFHTQIIYEFSVSSNSFPIESSPIWKLAWKNTAGYNGEWNFQQVTVDGSTIKVELNGSVILDADLSKVTEFMAERPHPGKDRTTGFFGFAGHNDPVEFRNVSIKELPPTPVKPEAK